MKKQIINFLLIIALSASVSAQTAKPELSEQNLRKHVSYLASDKLDGRRTGENGAVAAAGYIANMFASYRLKGGYAQKGKRNFLQPFPFTSEVLLGKENRLMLTSAGGNRAVELKNEWMPLGASANANFNNAETVFAGYGIVAEDAKRDDYGGKKVSGKIVVAFDGAPGDKTDPHNALNRFNRHAKAKLAKDRGAVGLILIARDADSLSEKEAKLSYDPSIGETAIPVALVSRSVGNLFFENAAQTAKAESGEIVDAKPYKTLLKINLEKKTGQQSYNVVGILEGTDFNLKTEAIVIGAHYDHLGRGGAGSLAANSTAIHHGADDNASGVAALLELARDFSQSKNNKRTLIFIAFGGEEEGLIGSKFYVNNPVFPLAKTVAMINMDMIGRLNQNKLTIGGVGTASSWRTLINSAQPRTAGATARQILADGSTVETVSAASPFFNLQLNEDGFGPSDHSSFYGKQIPVLFFFTGTHLDYHKPTDTAEKINYAGLEKIKNYVAAIAKSIDANPQKPAYTQAKSSGTTVMRTGFTVSLGTIPSYAESTDGMVLDGVRDNSPAAKAGLKAGDKITSLAGKEVRNVSDYTVILSEMKAGAEYQIIAMRGAEKLNLKIVPAARR